MSNESYNYTEHSYSKDTFYLGLTMAGAVSAGAYTGGVLDYLFEVLDKWERAKTGELKIPGYSKEDIPRHKVVIDAMGGTSAGGMTTAMAALYAIQGEINPVTDDKAGEVGGEKGNVFYDSWVNLDDTATQKTLENALTTHDLTSSGKIKALLNSAFIDSVAKSAFSIKKDDLDTAVSKLPPYISKDIEMLISHTMLKGIPLAVSFGHDGSQGKSVPPSHSTYEHFLFSHFKLNNGKKVNPDEYIWLNPLDGKSDEHLKKAAIATGAFPIGLEFRKFTNKDFRPEYIKNVLSRLIMKDMGDRSPAIKNKIKWDDKRLDNYESVTVDGGALNNEPYGEVMSILSHRYGPSDIKVGDHTYHKYGMVMIDPFPDFYQLKGVSESPDDLLGVAPGIIGTLWDQAKIKRNELREQFDNPTFRGTIYPVKYVEGKGNGKYEHPLACSALEAFSGFLDVRFRHHDFFLGRNNARNFLRAYLSVPYDPEKGIIHPLHTDEYWTEDMRKKFLITLNGETFLPLIPDLNMLTEEGVDTKAWISDYTVPDIPQISKQEIEGLKPQVYMRAATMLSLLLEVKNVKRYKEPGWVSRQFGKLLSWALEKTVRKKLRSQLSNMAAQKTIEHMVGELGQTGLLEGSTQPVILPEQQQEPKEKGKGKEKEIE